MAEKTKQRTIRMSLRLSDDMNNRLSVISEEIGVPSSTLCAFAVGEYVAQREKFESSKQLAFHSLPSS